MTPAPASPRVAEELPSQEWMDGLEAHMDEGGKVGQRECRELLAALRKAIAITPLIPDGWALDHLCQHYRAEDGRAHLTGGWTCKLGTDGGIGIRKVQAEGATAQDAISNAKARAMMVKP